MDTGGAGIISIGKLVQNSCCDFLKEIYTNTVLRGAAQSILHTQRRMKMQDQITKMAQQFAEQVKTAVPEVKFNKNGYEIRTQVLDMAKQFTEFEYSMKFNGYEQTAERDPQSGQIVTKVGMPDVPGIDKVLETAEKFYNFVNNSYQK
jgi:hypothetical protein